jgi:hypothetical protein
MSGALKFEEANAIAGRDVRAAQGKLPALTDYVREDGGTGRQDAQPDPPKLNPEWVELLMGWPRGWTQVDGYTAPRGKQAGKTTARASLPANPPTARTD